ncbi:MAG: TRAP transporter small permease [Proteobacteria bacterium]|nr:TRAP transporter small permease [Pseudomonadota bacterium]
MSSPGSFARLWGRLCEGADQLSRAIVGGSILAIVLITLVAVWYRYVLSAPLSWSEQVCRILFVWSVFAGAAVLYRQMLHIAIDMFVVMMPRPLQGLVFWVNQLLMLASALLLFIYGLRISLDNMGQTFGALDITPSWFYFAAPYCGLLMMLFFVEKLVDPVRREPDGAVHL